MELGHNDTVCQDLNTFRNETIVNEVQVYNNEFVITDKWISNVASLVYAIFAGALSDKHGRKLLILLPMFGKLLDGILSVINYTFIR